MVAVNAQEENLLPAFLLYDPANGVDGADANTSKVIRAPRYVAIEGMADAALTSVTVQVKVHKDAVWQDYQTVDTTSANALVEFLTPPNFVRIVRNPAASDGTEDFKVYGQQLEGTSI